MAAYEKLPSGKHSYTVRLPNGKRKRFTDPLKRVARQQAEDFEARLRRGEDLHLRDRRTTVGEWEKQWTPARNVEGITAAKNASHMRTHILPHWQSWPLASIGRIDVQGWVTGMTRAGVGATTISAAYHLFAAMMKAAALERKVAASPCVEIDLPRIVKPEERWLTRHEYERIQLALAEQPRGHVWQAMVALGCFSGLRPIGELAGLDVGDVDFDRRLVHVHQVLTRQGMRPYPKNDGSIRWAPFPEEVGKLLWRLCADRSQGPVFTSVRGLRVNEANFRQRVWKPALLAAGVDYVDPYTMRHTCVSWLAQAGVSSDEIADIVGHSSTRMIRTIYRHMRPDAHDRVRAAWAHDSGTRTPRVPHAENEESPHPAGWGL